MLTRRKLITRTGQVALVATWLPHLTACDEQPKQETLTETPAASEPQGLAEFLLVYSSISFAGPSCALKLGLTPLHDPEGMQQTLMGELEAKLQSVSSDNVSSSAISAGLQQLMRADFAQSRVLDIEGWQLSETECQAIALAASLQGFNEPVAVALAPPTEEVFLDVKNWGPQKTLQGERFNEQPDGHSGLWLVADNIPPSTILLFAGRQLETNVYDGSLTSGLHGKFMNSTINVPGNYPVELYDRSHHRVQPLGDFVVVERREPLPFDQCEVTLWGPVQAISGQPFNQQANGSSALWFQSNCTPENGVVMLDGVDMDTTMRPENAMFTASMPGGENLLPGEHRLELRFGDSGNVLSIGTFTVYPAAEADQ